MAQNKKSIWSFIILIASIVALVLLISSIVVSAIALPAQIEAAKQSLQGTVPAEELEIAVILSVSVIIAAIVFNSIFDILKVIGGFMFSLKGRWGIFCIIVSLISVATGIWGLVSDIKNNSGVAAIAISGASLAVSLLLCVACFAHRAENNR